ncbi:MAG: (d)CMP kinase [Cytophagaceae bacterium]|jgi:cytidylate kinase|nr:(d)CMP kinase [Cytophagaceae bacterium]
MRKIIVAIDGYSACGKSTTAKLLAAKLGYSYIDTGAMYRAVTLYFLQHYIPLTDPKDILEALENIHIQFQHVAKTGKSELYLNGLNVEDEIRKMYVSDKVSEVSALPQVRKQLTEMQRKIGKKKGVVMDGRDIGTTVFPDAELKIFMTADMRVRAYRRQLELLEKKQIVDLDDIMANLEHRDHIDRTRQESPLRKALNAFEIDSTYITVEEQVDCILNLAVSKMIELEFPISKI